MKRKYIVLEPYENMEDIKRKVKNSCWLMTRQEVIEEYRGIYAFGYDKCVSLEDAYLTILRFEYSGDPSIIGFKSLEKKLKEKGSSLEEWKEEKRDYITSFSYHLKLFELKEDGSIEKIDPLDWGLSPLSI